MNNMKYTEFELKAFELGDCQRNWAIACGGADNVNNDIWNALESVKFDLLSDKPSLGAMVQAEILLAASKY